MDIMKVTYFKIMWKALQGCNKIFATVSPVGTPCGPHLAPLECQKIPDSWYQTATNLSVEPVICPLSVVTASGYGYRHLQDHKMYPKQTQELVKYNDKVSIILSCYLQVMLFFRLQSTRSNYFIKDYNGLSYITLQLQEIFYHNIFVGFWHQFCIPGLKCYEQLLLFVIGCVSVKQMEKHIRLQLAAVLMPTFLIVLSCTVLYCINFYSTFIQNEYNVFMFYAATMFNFIFCCPQ